MNITTPWGSLSSQPEGVAEGPQISTPWGGFDIEPKQEQELEAG